LFVLGRFESGLPERVEIAGSLVRGDGAGGLFAEFGGTFRADGGGPG
jgi:hypothetical protein